MAEIKFKNFRICLDFSFFAVLALFLFADESGFGLAALGTCFMHEAAHFLAMAAFGVPIKRLTLYGAGIRITSPFVEYISRGQKAVILSAGCAVNFAAAVIYSLCGNDFLCAVNLFTGIFNLLPLGTTDGAGLLKMLLIRKCKVENVDKLMRAANRASIIICAAAAVAAGGRVSFTLITTALYFLILGSREP